MFNCLVIFIMNMDENSIDKVIHPNHENHCKNGMQECVEKCEEEKCEGADRIMGPASKRHDARRTDETPYRDALIGRSADVTARRPGGK